ncbi:unnamed protein product [Parnassius apollo]|uniref:(apollo) hypothetical protein n=1 Tax=Parnassius apollo TaxID=110799 RepID=A0A8S3WET4_PARAO|nr:unnamed protein product [Parnassius apollo]
MPYEECGVSSTTDHKYIKDTKSPHSKEDTETLKTNNTLPASLNIITSPSLKDIFTEGFNSTNEILTRTEATMVKIYPNLSTVIISNLLTTSISEKMSEKSNFTTSIIPMNKTVTLPSTLVTSELKVNESWTSKSNDEASINISHSHFVSPVIPIRRNCTRKKNNTYSWSLPSTAAYNNMSYSSHATQEKVNKTNSKSFLSTITSNVDSVFTPSVLKLSTSKINLPHTKDTFNTVTEISLETNASIFNLSKVNNTSKPSFINLQTIKNTQTNTEAPSIPNTAEKNTITFNTTTNAKLASFKATTKMETEYNITKSLKTVKTSPQTPCATNTYPKNCNRPFTWETTLKGERRDMFQILRANFGDKIKTLNGYNSLA